MLSWGPLVGNEDRNYELTVSSITMSSHVVDHRPLAYTYCMTATKPVFTDTARYSDNVDYLVSRSSSVQKYAPFRQQCKQIQLTT